MQRLSPLLRLHALRTSPHLRPTQAFLTTPIRTASTTSSPASASGPSAASGGSRSKSAADPSAETLPDSLSEGDARGRSGGGEPLSASQHPPPQPKISNHSVPGARPGEGLTEEQRREVDEHNADFEKKHDRANPAEDDKVDKGFWGGRDGGSKD